MVSIFDDEVEEVGSEIDAYCPKCKADTTHVIISKYEDEIRRVQCNPCGDVHAFRKPRGEMEDEPPEPIAVKKRAAKVKPTWEQVMAKSAKKQPRVYMVADRFGENEVVSHPKFGTGFVSEVIGLDKIEVTFQSEKRVLIHNRPGMSLPPAAYAHPVDATLSDAARKGAKPEKAKANGKAAPEPTDKKAAANGKLPVAAARKPEPEAKKPEAKKPEAKPPAGKAQAPAPVARPDGKKAATKAEPPKAAAPKAAPAKAAPPTKAAAPKAAAPKAAAPKAAPPPKAPPAKAGKKVEPAPAPARKPEAAAHKPDKKAKPEAAAKAPAHKVDKKAAAKAPASKAAKPAAKPVAKKPAAKPQPVKAAARKPAAKPAAKKPAKAPAVKAAAHKAPPKGAHKPSKQAAKHARR